MVDVLNRIVGATPAPRTCELADPGSRSSEVPKISLGRRRTEGAVLGDLAASSARDLRVGSAQTAVVLLTRGNELLLSRHVH